MKRSSPPKRKRFLSASWTPIPTRRKDPKTRRFAARRCKPFTDWLKQEACAITGKRTGQWAYDPAFAFDPWSFVVVDPAHVRERSLGGDDLDNCFPLARHLHNEQEGHDAEFQAKYGVNLKDLAIRYTERFLALHPEWAGAHAGGTDQ